MADFKAATKDIKEIILVCNIGGSVEADDTISNQTGRQSRSLIAAFEIYDSMGNMPLKVLKGGFYGWRNQGRKTTTSTSDSDTE